jgi:twitching motility protein PilT
MVTRSKPSLLGRIAVHLKLLSMEQLARATAEQGRCPEKNLGEIFVELGFLDERQLAKLIQAQQQVLARQRASRAAERAAPEPEAGTAAPAAQVEAPARPVDAAARRAAVQPPSAGPLPQEGEAAVSLGLSLAEPDSVDRERLHGLLRDAVAAGASDVHLHAGAPPRRRIHGRLEAWADAPLDPALCERLVAAALTGEERRWLAERGELDLCSEIPGVGRFRANVYRQQRGFDAVFRAIPARPPTLEELGLPNALARFTNYHQGMVLLTGPAGCGKSSTMAALVNLINEERQEHILCIEDPVEYVHPSRRCLVNQRHAGRHTASFARALRGALREDPDVIVIGELRDLETISLAMTAAETGHFVLATLHTNDAIRTLNRMIGAFPSNQQDQVRTMLSESLRAVVSQRLLNRRDGSGRVPAIEILVVTKAISHMIRDQKTVQIRSAMQTGKRQGMCLLEQSLAELVQAGEVERQEALRHVEDPKGIPG